MNKFEKQLVFLVMKLADNFFKIRKNGRTIIGVEVLEKESEKLNRSVCENEKGKREISLWVEGELEGVIYFKIVDGEAIPLESVPANKKNIQKAGENARFLGESELKPKKNEFLTFVGDTRFDNPIAKAARKAKDRYHNSEEFKEEVAKVDIEVLDALEKIGNPRRSGKNTKFNDIEFFYKGEI